MLSTGTPHERKDMSRHSSVKILVAVRGLHSNICPKVAQMTCSGPGEDINPTLTNLFEFKTSLSHCIHKLP